MGFVSYKIDVPYVKIVRLWPKKGKEKIIVVCSALANEKNNKKGKKRKKRKKKRRKEKQRKEKKRKNILVVRLWPMKRKQPGLLRVIDTSKIER